MNLTTYGTIAIVLHVCIDERVRRVTIAKLPGIEQANATDALCEFKEQNHLLNGASDRLEAVWTAEPVRMDYRTVRART